MGDEMKSFWNSFDRMLVILVMIGLILHYWGVAFNSAALIANNGSMPVVGMSMLEEIANNDGKARHGTDVGQTHLSLLVDRIRIDFPAISTSWKPIRTWVRLLDYPAEGGVNIVSIGDLMRWIGSLLFLLMLPMLIVRIPFRVGSDGIPFRR